MFIDDSLTGKILSFIQSDLIQIHIPNSLSGKAKNSRSERINVFDSMDLDERDLISAICSPISHQLGYQIDA